MRLFYQYLKGYRREMIIAAIVCLVFIGSFLLYHLPVEAVLYPTALSAGIVLVAAVFDFFRVRRKHENLQKIRSITDLVTEDFPKARRIEEEEYQQIIHALDKEHTVYRSMTNDKYKEMTEYYTLWAHQIKTPIASMRLHLQNEDSSLSRKLTGDLHRIEQYVEMVLTFLRLQSESTDYVFGEYDLDLIVRAAVRRFSSDFIERKISLVYEPLNVSIVTDEKWLSFVIEQVLSNALKYTLTGSITISLVGEKTLRIKDTGIGIASEDLPRIFENGYTGYNGRAGRKASGIGLYLCKRICSKLGHGITASSEVGVGTAIDIDLSRQKLEIE